MEDNVINIEDKLHTKKIKQSIQEITKDPNFKKRIDKYFSSLTKEQKLGKILSDFGSNADILDLLGYTPSVLVKEFGFDERGLRNVGFSPKKLRELGYKVKDFYKHLK